MTAGPLDLSHLTPTHRRVLGLLAAGYTTEEAAALCGITVRTAATHITTAIRRTHATNRVHLVAELVRQGNR